MGIVPPSQTLPKAVGFDQEEREGFDFKPSVDSCGLPAWDSLSDSDQEELDFRRSLYAAQIEHMDLNVGRVIDCLLYTSPSPRDGLLSRMPSSA